jgi:hypothetical protein
MAPKSSIASSRLTITCSAAIRRAPVDRLMLTTAGSSCGVSPTASASENSSDSTNGRCSTRLTTKVTVTSATIARTSSSPNAVIPRSNPVRTLPAASRADTPPNSVDRPVLATTTSPAPLTTWVPMNRLLERLASGASAATMPGRFSTG